MKFKLLKAFLASSLIGFIYFYFWIFFGLGHQLEITAFKNALMIIGFSIIPVIFGILFDKIKVLLLGGFCLFFGIAIIFVVHGEMMQKQSLKDKEQHKKENEMLMAKAKEVLKCEDGNVAVLYSEKNADLKSETLVFSLLYSSYDRTPGILCIWRLNQPPLCRGLDYQMKEKNLACSNEKFSNLHDVQSRFFTEIK